MYALGKSTLIKLLVQEVEPDPDCGGTVWKHMNLRVAYVVHIRIHTYTHLYIKLVGYNHSPALQIAKHFSFFI